MNFQQQFVEQTVPKSMPLKPFNTQKFITDYKDIGPWNTSSKASTPHNVQKRFECLQNIRRRNKTNRTSESFEQQTVITKRFRTHVFQFVDCSKINKVCSLQKNKKPYTFRQFQLSNCLPEQKEAQLKNPLEPVFVSLLKYKKTKLKNKMSQCINRLMKKQPKQMIIPSLSQDYFQDRHKRLAPLFIGYQKANSKFTSKPNKYIK